MKKGEINKISINLLFFFLILFIIFCIFFFYQRQICKISLEKERPVSILSFSDLTRLSKNSYPIGMLKQKLEKQLTTPYILNVTNLNRFTAPSIKVAHWNIEKGLNSNAVRNIFLNKDSFYYTYAKNLKEGQKENLRKELNELVKSNIICLNEVDIGMPRTSYKNIAGEIAETLNSNYAFATEFVELGPIVGMINVSSDKYLGLHGNAIISKYPIKRARILRLPQCYKWFEAEIERKSLLEKARRFGAKKVFEQGITTEVRHGGRCALIVDIELPNKEMLTVVSAHLEDRCYPDSRLKQAKYLFENLKNIRNPVVIAGDFNTSTTDTAPTSVKKELLKRLRDKDFVARQLILAIVPLGIPIPGVANVAAYGIGKALQYKDPASPNIPILFPNQERKFFKYVKSFRFADGEMIDIKGNRSSNGKRGLFANSNERQLKGFESTFKLEEPRIIAYYKLDWFFVKPKRGRFSPFNGQTLQLVNHAFPGRISDHEPIVVDLTL